MGCECGRRRPAGPRPRKHRIWRSPRRVRQKHGWRRPRPPSPTAPCTQSFTDALKPSAAIFTQPARTPPSSQAREPRRNRPQIKPSQDRPTSARLPCCTTNHLPHQSTNESSGRTHSRKCSQHLVIRTRPGSSCSSDRPLRPRPTREAERRALRWIVAGWPRSGSGPYATERWTRIARKELVQVVRADRRWSVLTSQRRRPSTLPASVALAAVRTMSRSSSQPPAVLPARPVDLEAAVGGMGGGRQADVATPDADEMAAPDVGTVRTAGSDVEQRLQAYGSWAVA